MLERKVGKATVMLEDSLGPEDLAMVQALYSRSSKSAAAHLADLSLARAVYVQRSLAPTAALSDVVAALDASGSDRASSFMARYYVGYGHASIADCGSTTLFFENVSLLAAKAIQNSPLYSGQETSTRYLDMSSRDVADPVATPASARVADRWMTFYRRALPLVEESVRARHPRLPGEDEATFDRAARARAFDISRGFLPAGVTTQLSWHTNLRQAADHLAWLAHHPLSEVRDLAGAARSLLQDAYPSSFRGARAGLSGVAAGDGQERRDAWQARVMRWWAYPACPDEFAPPGEATFSTTVSNDELSAFRHELQDRPRGAVLPHWFTDLGQLSFRFFLDFGSWRDVQRHRNGTCRAALLTTRHGMEPWYLSELPASLRSEAATLAREQEDEIMAIRRSGSGIDDAQYLTPLAYRVPCHLSYGLPAAVYVAELRSGRAVHPTLRRRALWMARQLRQAHPLIALHADESPGDWDLRRGRQTITELDKDGEG